MGILLASPAAPAPPEAAPVDWSGIQEMTWTGWDGTVVDFIGAGSPVRLVNDGVRGLGMPAFQRFTAASPAIAGVRHRGSQAEAREVHWPLLVHSFGGSAEWFDTDAMFWGSLHPDHPGVWRVTTPTSGTRSLRCRFVDDTGHAYNRDPARAGWAVYGVNLVADQPFWEGEPVHREWEPGTTQPFLPGPPFWISSGSQLGSATIPNPGDAAQAVIWELSGPITEARVGVPGRQVHVPFEIPAGQTLTVDTRRDRLTAVTGAGVDRTADLGESGWAVIPPKGEAQLALTMTGTGRISASLTPLFFRAWG